MTTARDVIDAIFSLRVDGKCTDENGIAACLEAYVDSRIARARTVRQNAPDIAMLKTHECVKCKRLLFADVGNNFPSCPTCHTVPLP